MININIYIKFGVKKQDIITISEEKTIILRPLKLIWKGYDVLIWSVCFSLMWGPSPLNEFSFGIVYKTCKYLLNEQINH